MPSWRAIRRAVADPTLIGVLLISGLVIALGCALADTHPGIESASSNSFDAPCPPLPPCISSAQEPKFVRLLNSHLPVGGSRVLAGHGESVKAGFYRGEQHRLALRKFCPLYHRPPPIVS
jgi:hypothetical protein